MPARANRLGESAALDSARLARRDFEIAGSTARASAMEKATAKQDQELQTEVKRSVMCRRHASLAGVLIASTLTGAAAAPAQPAAPAAAAAPPTAVSSGPGKVAAMTPPEIISHRRLVDFVEEKGLDLDEELALVVDSGRAAVSAVSGGRPVTQADALANARKLLEAKVGRQTLVALRTAPEAASLGRLQAMATAALAANKPYAALAALLRAHELAPRDRQGLVNLGGLLARAGLANEALALLDAADKLGGRRGSPMGIDGAAVALNARGYALLLLRRYSEAETALRAALAREPLLSEAARNLAFVLHEQGKQQEAKRRMIVGVWRIRDAERRYDEVRRTPPDRTPPDKDGVRLPIDQVFDLSAGKEGRLPPLRHPKSIPEVLPRSPQLTAQFTARASRLGEAGQRMLEAQRAVGKQGDAFEDRLAQAIVTEASTWASGVGGQAEFHPTKLAMESARADWVRAGERIGRAFTEEAQRIQLSVSEEAWRRRPTPSGWSEREICKRMRAPADSTLQQLFPFARRVELAAAEHFAITYRVASGLVANLSDPKWHAAAASQLEHTSVTFHLMLQMELDQAYTNVSLPYPVCDRETRPGQDDQSVFPKADRCPAALRTHAVKLALVDSLSIEFNCEKAKLGVETPGILGAFAEVEFNIDGSISVFAGPKAGVDGGIGPTIKDGLYITTRGGEVTDFGFRVGTEIGASGGRVGMSGDVDSMDFSFVPSAG